MAPDSKLPAVADADALASALQAVARHRDRRAFALIFAHFAPRLNAYLLRLGSDAAGAEDLLQDIMLTVWRRAELYDPTQAAVSTWIFAIARNRRIDALRRAGRPELDADDPALLPEAIPAADQTVAAGQWQRRLSDALRDLPHEQSEMLKLAYFDDRSHRDIAAHLKLPLGTVKSRLRLAIARLRGKLGERA